MSDSSEKHQVPQCEELSTREDAYDNLSVINEGTRITAASTYYVDRLKKVHDIIEYYIELPSVQIFVLMLIYFDILLGATQKAVDNNVNPSIASNSFDFETLRMIILYVHAIELLMQMAVFRNRYFSHWGYSLDTLLITTRLLNRHTKWVFGLENSHLTGFLRVWRFLRLIQTYLAIETKHHIHTKRELSCQLRAVDEFKKKTACLESDLERERLLRKQNEDVAKKCRDEMETLREALRIASFDVVAAMRGDHRLGGIEDMTVEGEDTIKPMEYKSIGPEKK
ncbi:hypothetical protein HJC23_009635 [Cyclotella cryptica]|uniref:Voltage-gated hydrogen channel 1 n=1 Tax=Cyclotella cryptica TaxID=29204 RepID=A0ABD3PY85_9STRA|eukprot:CCRYP_010905-RA/>CCRYP_010905-RA protein AED:0.32 eAED:0.26 QI:0/-1/0/1/-1/1/1/0/281